MVDRNDFGEDYATYLLTWNPGKSSWDDFQEDWENVYAGNRPHFWWSCGNTRRIQVGDRVFLMRLGWREKVTGILASGWVTHKPKVAPHYADGDRTGLYVEFEPDVLLNPETDKLLNPNVVSQDFNWRPQSSGVTIPVEIAFQLDQIWQQHIQGISLIDAPEQLKDKTSQSFREGSRTMVTSYRYERNPRAREDCVRHYGTQCIVCGFDFSEVFGEIGEGFIHVHHLNPVSNRDAEYMIDPIEDLSPVCPNCHAMLHRRSPPYSIAELKDIRRRAGHNR